LYISGAVIGIIKLSKTVAKRQSGERRKSDFNLWRQLAAHLGIISENLPQSEKYKCLCSFSEYENTRCSWYNEEEGERKIDFSVSSPSLWIQRSIRYWVRKIFGSRS
jgi:hypothetical protein